WMETYATQLESSGSPASAAQLEYFRQRYGLDRPLHEQYWRWIVPVVTRGDFGFSFEWQQPVSALIADRLLLTVVVSLSSLAFVYAVSIAIALYSATHQYSLSDYFFSLLGIIGLATPSFLLALILLVLCSRFLGFTPTGLFSPEYLTAPWSLGKWLDLLAHLPVPVVVIGLSGTAATIRILRSQLLDEFNKQYVTTARAKGLTERRLLLKYPFRMALNPIVSTMGTLLPSIVSGATIVAIVLGLPTVGPLLLRAIVAQDTYVAASCLMMLGVLTVVGVFISDMLLMWLDPRVRMERGAR
ncbi:MAG: ABC transporter permease, partial [Alphaproteobacteria bacterium]|nr:ABC transporter permease [Alphaproteobacteria bacterium]